MDSLNRDDLHLEQPGKRSSPDGSTAAYNAAGPSNASQQAANPAQPIPIATPQRPQEPHPLLVAVASSSSPSSLEPRHAAFSHSPLRSRRQNLLQTPAKARQTALDLGDVALDQLDADDLIPSSTPSRQHEQATPSGKGKADGWSKAPHRRDSGDADKRSIVEQHRLPRPPSFAESQFQTIIRRQRKRRILSAAHEGREDVSGGALPTKGDAGASTGIKPDVFGRPSSSSRVDADNRFEQTDMEDSYGSSSGLHLKVGRNRSGPNRAGPLNSYEFAGWGEMSMLEVTPGEMAAARRRVEDRVVKPSSLLGQFRATAIAGNAVTGSIFYALPSIFAVAGIWTPVCLVLAALLIIPVLVIMHGLASALKSANAGSYSYLINVSSRMIALIGGSITILDAISTGAVSSATAASYVSEEAPRLSMPIFTILFLLILTAICLLGMKDSSTIALSMFTLHTLSIAALIVAGVVSWTRTGNAVIRENWSIAAGGAELLGGKSTARALFDGTVVAFVGLTGFETTVAYAGDLKPGAFFLALRNIWVTVTLLSAPSALLILATIPFPQILGANNVLALLASSAGGRALQLVIVIDASVVLCGGVLTGAISCTGVLLAMAKDGTLPGKLGWAIKRTGAPLWCLTTYLLLCVAMVATASFSQITVASIFSIIFLGVLTLFGLASLLLLFSRPLLPRSKVSLPIILLSLTITTVSLVGNVLLSPTSLGLTLAYLGVVGGTAICWANRVPIARIGLVWLPAQIDWFRRIGASSGAVGAGAGRKGTRIDERVETWIRETRRSTKAVFLTSSDELSVLVQAIIYVKNNEPSIGRVILVHCYDKVDEIPPELESNHQLVDEAFPTITVDLCFIEAPFNATTLEFLSHRLKVPLPRFFIGCPTSSSQQDVGLLGGVRIILD
ncbi:hypothetical protein BCV69DRAFT_93664 [Microstroma glucosiphilum]|uniref:Uncharacterized protein n=1 Tax=Pseudomicrostroma glucosiphilum TaxID=1684307 RepID=A0A316UCU9_9BASI|nr:hypothetical protein BCV69DRAFT_93664 [Pseudomicrostroma glucosiphilum]PWN22664.1 hypothetical protein BCV69DRAFT_93664 [Pseudomicrostroma glucosiphilum]